MLEIYIYAIYSVSVFIQIFSLLGFLFSHLFFVAKLNIFIKIIFCFAVREMFSHVAQLGEKVNAECH